MPQAHKNIPNPSRTSFWASLDKPIQHPPHVQEALERNRRFLLCSPLLSKPHEINGWVIEGKDGPQLQLSLRDEELDRKFKSPRAPVTVTASFAEWRAEFALTPRLLAKLTPLLQKVAPALLLPAEQLEK